MINPGILVLLAAVVVLPTDSVRDWTRPNQWLGCWKDTSDRAMEYQQEESTVQACVTDCNEKGKLYAGMQNKTKCFCGNDYKKHGPEEVDVCNMPCSDGSCGGLWANDVYRTSIPVFATHKGCYRDAPNRAGYHRHYDTSYTTAQLCARFCVWNGHKYSGSEASRECHCHWDWTQFTRHGGVTGNWCDKRGDGGDNDRLGGSWHLSIYEIEVFTGTYIGCFKDDGNDRALLHEQRLPIGVGKQQGSSANMCQEYCMFNGYKYTGVQVRMIRMHPTSYSCKDV
eukprot:GHVU01033242.1.p1 GENE.GHVU01033242.1~~GHVU01033242.1.p1  ORF type:complete len:282 (+),score=11.08 GHVU01033242.1:431-1276(+)